MLGSIVRNNCVSIVFTVTIVMATCEDREMDDPLRLANKAAEQF